MLCNTYGSEAPYRIHRVFYASPDQYHVSSAHLLPCAFSRNTSLLLRLLTIVIITLLAAVLMEEQTLRGSPLGPRAIGAALRALAICDWP